MYLNILTEFGENNNIQSFDPLLLFTVNFFLLINLSNLSILKQNLLLTNFDLSIMHLLAFLCLFVYKRQTNAQSFMNILYLLIKYGFQRLKQTFLSLVCKTDSGTSNNTYLNNFEILSSHGG